MYWQSCEVSKPFDPLLLDMMMDALGSYHLSDFAVGNHVFSSAATTKTTTSDRLDMR